MVLPILVTLQRLGSGADDRVERASSESQHKVPWTVPYPVVQRHTSEVLSSPYS